MLGGRLGLSFPSSTLRTLRNRKSDGPGDMSLNEAVIQTVVGRFTEQAARTPEAEAVRFEGVGLTYGALDRRSNQLARHLQGLGVKTDVLVGVCLERSVEMVVAVLAVLKAGGAYLPLDPAYPSPRLSFMLEDAKAPVLLTQAKLRAGLPAFAGPVLCLDESPALFAPEAPASPVDASSLEGLAYAIYTSGSTGTPKGVAMGHGPLANLITWQLDQSIAGPGTRTLQFSPLSFDVSFQELFGTWCSGGTLVLVRDELRLDAVLLLKLLADERVERLFLPFIALQSLSEIATSHQKVPPSLREVVTAGEQLQVTHHLRAFFSALPGCALHNHYGPSETHVVSSYVLRGSPDAWPALPPIGKAIDGCELVVLDEQKRPVPHGESGELFLAGVCLARGYLHREALTAERFVAHPLRPGTGERAYRTGDLARVLPGGDVEFLGRIDGQVKVRGYRIELGEIEVALGSHPAVKQVAVVAREDVPGDKRLVAYVVPDGTLEHAAGTLRRHLGTKVPDYMVPSAFVVLEALPRLLRAGRQLAARAPVRGAAAAGARAGDPHRPALPVAHGGAVGGGALRRRIAALAQAAVGGAAGEASAGGRWDGGLGAGGHHRHGGPLPRRSGRGDVLEEPGRRGGIRHHLHAGAGGSVRGRGRARRARVRARARHPGGRGALRRGLLRHHAEGGTGDGSAAAPLPGDGLVRAGVRRLRTGDVPGPHRRLRGHAQQQLPAAARPAPAGHRGQGGRLPGDGRQREGLRGHARRAQAGPARPGPVAQHRVLHVAGRGGAGVLGFADAPVRRGAGGRRGGDGAAALRPPVPGGRHALPGRALPALRRERHRDALQRRRGRGGAQAPVGRAGGRRRHPRGAARRGRQQRRRGQDELRGAGRGGTGHRHRDGARERGRGSAHHPLRGGARHRDAAGRPHRSGGAVAGLPRAHRRHRLLRHRFGEEQLRPPHRRGGRGGPAQDGARPEAPRAAADAALPDAQPEDRLRQEPLLRPDAALRVAGGQGAPARGRQLLRRGRHQRARRGGGGPRPACLRPVEARPVAPRVGQDARGRDAGGAAIGRAPPGEPGASARGRGAHAVHRPARVPLPQGRGRGQRRGGREGADGGRGGGHRAGVHPAPRVPLPRSGLAAPGHGARTVPPRARLPRHGGCVRGGVEAAARPRPARGALPEGPRVPRSRRGAAPDVLRAGGAVHGGVRARAALVELGRASGRARGPQRGRVRRRVPRGRLHAGGRAAPGRQARPAHAGAGAGQHAVGAPVRRSHRAPADGRAGHRIGQRAASVRRLRSHGRGAAAPGHAGGGGRGEPAAPDIARVPLADDGRRGGALPRNGEGHAPVGAAHPHRLHRDGHVAHARRGDVPRLLGAAPARHGPLRARAAHALGQGRPPAAGGGPARDARHAGAAAGHHRTARPGVHLPGGVQRRCGRLERPLECRGPALAPGRCPGLGSLPRRRAAPARHPSHVFLPAAAPLDRPRAGVRARLHTLHRSRREHRPRPPRRTSHPHPAQPVRGTQRPGARRCRRGRELPGAGARLAGADAGGARGAEAVRREGHLPAAPGRGAVAGRPRRVPRRSDAPGGRAGSRARGRRRAERPRAARREHPRAARRRRAGRQRPRVPGAGPVRARRHAPGGHRTATAADDPAARHPLRSARHRGRARAATARRRGCSRAGAGGPRGSHRRSRRRSCRRAHRRLGGRGRAEGPGEVRREEGLRRHRAHQPRAEGRAHAPAAGVPGGLHPPLQREDAGLQARGAGEPRPVVRPARGDGLPAAAQGAHLPAGGEPLQGLAALGRGRQPVPGRAQRLRLRDVRPRAGLHQTGRAPAGGRRLRAGAHAPAGG
ncbi:MAG: amino acid adenylation domain-containing protein [Myxococcaceae bacterium]|nr:MAG: amino acid adenylation domain-containing protein [Myxococcaceae bacterium]